MTDKEIIDLAHELYPIYTAGDRLAVEDCVNMAIDVIKKAQTNAQQPHLEAFEMLCIRLDSAESGRRAFNQVEELCNKLGMKKDEYESRCDAVLRFIRADYTVISVNDRLPTKHGSYLVYAPKTFPKNSRWMVAEYYDDVKGFYSESSENHLPDVTHWCELPEEQ